MKNLKLLALGFLKMILSGNKFSQVIKNVHNFTQIS